MGRHTVRKGKDNKGEYIEYVDKWDLDPSKYVNRLLETGYKIDEASKAITPILDLVEKQSFKPFDIYGRQYYKDYGDGEKKKMYYSDDELLSFDEDKKNFDTLALQRELSNRGYKLSKSKKKDGDFDGILGKETIDALKDYQGQQ